MNKQLLLLTMLIQYVMQTHCGDNRGEILGHQAYPVPSPC